MSLVPWTKIHENTSPFIMVFAELGVPAASAVMALVVLTAGLSSSNSGIFSTSRMLHSLAHKHHAPSALKRTSRRHVPAPGVIVSAAAMLIGVIVNYIAPQQAFVYLTSVGTIGAIFIWVMIVITHLKYRQRTRQVSRLRAFTLPLAPWSNYFMLIFLALIAILLAFTPETRVALYVGPIWVAVVCFGYRFFRRDSSESRVQHPPFMIGEPDHQRGIRRVAS